MSGNARDNDRRDDEAASRDNADEDGAIAGVRVDHEIDSEIVKERGGPRETKDSGDDG